MSKINSLYDLPSVARYLQRVGAEPKPRAMFTAVVSEMGGRYPVDRTVIRVSKEGAVQADKGYEPTSEERRDIEAECRAADWPSLKLLPHLVDLPEMVRNAHPDNVFELRTPSGHEIIMLHVRIEVKGQRQFLPFTYWDDDQWRMMEPDGLLPLYGLDKIGTNTTVCIHEGCKAARRLNPRTHAEKQWLAKHPWRDALQGMAHIGWIGGANNAHRTDWSILEQLNIKRAYIVADNDREGVAAVAAIAKKLRCITFHVQFSQQWKTGFDLADDFPPEMFADGLDGGRVYIGPEFEACVNPATWATDLVPDAKGKFKPVLRKHFSDLWGYVEEINMFVCKERPDIIRTKEVLNQMLSGFSDEKSNTCGLITGNYTGRILRTRYLPECKEILITDNEGPAINLHLPSLIKSKEGDPKPFIDFIHYLFPNKAEARQVLRWCATLIARLDIRMAYGLLLCSETQGVGKSRLATKILQPLVGANNTSNPSEAEIVDSNFNGWAFHRRLVIAHEMYAGQSRKAADTLKSAITEEYIRVNEKYMKPHMTDNRLHVYACSNSMHALKLDAEDRRWFCAEVTEVKWSEEKFKEFQLWLDNGGLSIIKYWAERFGDYVRPTEDAPQTQRKTELANDSRSNAQREAIHLAKAVMNAKEPIAIVLGATIGWLHSSVRGQIYDRDYDIKKAMRSTGMIFWGEQMYVDNRMQYVGFNRAALEQMRPVADIEVNDKKGVASLKEGTSPEVAKQIRAMLRKFQRPPADVLSPQL